MASLTYLESLSPEAALRHKVLQAARLPADALLYLFGDSVASLDHAERSDLGITVAAAAKAFTLLLADEAISIRDAANRGDASADGALRERHVLEAFRRLALHGVVPGAAEWRASSAVDAEPGAGAECRAPDGAARAPADVR